MPVNRVAEDVTGTIGTICWTIQLIPQIWKSWRTKSTEGLSHYLVLLWAIAAGFLGVYVVVQNLNIPLILQPQLLGILSLVSWGQCQYYGVKRSRTVSVALVLILAAVIGGLEAGMVFVIKPSYGGGNKQALRFFGIMSSVLLSIALFPQYYQIWKHSEVVGISITFMAIDLAGGVFSDLSLLFKKDFDVIAAVAYSLVVFLDLIVVIAAMILNPRAAYLAGLETANPTTTVVNANPTSQSPNSAEREPEKGN